MWPTYLRQCWRCGREFQVTCRTPLPSRSSRQTSPMIYRHVGRHRQTARSTKRSDSKDDVVIRSIISFYKHTKQKRFRLFKCCILCTAKINTESNSSPSQTGALGRSRGCPGHGSPLPVWSMWRSRRSGWAGPRAWATRPSGRPRWAAPKWRSGTSRQRSCHQTSRCLYLWPDGDGEIRIIR